MHRFPATSGERRGVDILDGPRGEHIGGRHAATLAVLMDRLRALRTEVGSMRARSRLAGVGLRRSGDHRRDHVGQPLVLIDAKTLVQDAGTRLMTCGNVGVTSEGPHDYSARRQSVSHCRTRRSPEQRSWGHSASSLAFRASMLERVQPRRQDADVAAR